LAGNETDDKTTTVDGRQGRASWFLAMAVVLAIAVVVGVAIGWLIGRLGQPVDPDLSVDGQASADLISRLALVSWAIGLGILVLLVLLATLVRRWLLAVEEQARATEAQLAVLQDQLALDRTAAAEQAGTAESNLRAERFSRAIAQATGESVALRAIGLLALEELAIDDEEHVAASVYEFLIALIKEKATPNPQQSERFAERREPGSPTRPQLPHLDTDVATAVTILARNRSLFDRNIAALGADTVANGGSGLHLVDADLSGVWLRGLSLAGATLTNVRLNGSVLVDVDLRDALLTDCRAGDATFDSVDFTKARFHSSTFAESTFNETRFDRATLSATDFGASAITKTSFKRANATGTGFVGAVFTDSTFDESLLTGTSFQGALFTDLGGAATTFTRSTLSSVACNEATFVGTDFSWTAINDADFADARLTKATFNGANLRQTNFRSAMLDEVAFDEADLGNVMFDEPTIAKGTLLAAATITDEIELPVDMSSDGGSSATPNGEHDLAGPEAT
jgi:uncharacterized protein YjbI with pentapeptide repeats